MFDLEVPRHWNFFVIDEEVNDNYRIISRVNLHNKI